jgi:glycosyltransferase involved in cell wall biosynthesis
MTAALRVAFLQPTIHGGGAERAVTSWIEHGVRAGHDVALLTLAAGTYDQHRTGGLPDGVPHRQAPAPRGGRLAAGLARAWWVRRRCRELRADVLVANLSYANLIALAAFPWRRRRTAVVLVEQNPASVLLASEGSPGRAKRLAARWLYRLADGVIAISHAVAADAMSGLRVDRNRVWVLAPPVSGPGTDRPRAPRPERVDLVFVGRLVAQKQPARVVEALLGLRALGVDARGTFIGAGPLAPELRERAERAGVPCAFLGWVESWAEEVTRRAPAAVLLLPSKVEGLGFVLIEAACAGIPVVAPSQALGVGDAIVPGVTGTLALSDRPEHLVEAVLDAAARPDAPALAGWYRWFDAGTSGRRLFEILETVVRERGS